MCLPNPIPPLRPRLSALLLYASRDVRSSVYMPRSQESWFSVRGARWQLRAAGLCQSTRKTFLVSLLSLAAAHTARSATYVPLRYRLTRLHLSMSPLPLPAIRTSTLAWGRNLFRRRNMSFQRVCCAMVLASSATMRIPSISRRTKGMALTALAVTPTEAGGDVVHEGERFPLFPPRTSSGNRLSPGRDDKSKHLRPPPHLKVSFLFLCTAPLWSK